MTELRIEGYYVEESCTDTSFALIVPHHPIVVIGKTRQWVHDTMAETLKKYSSGEIKTSNKKVEAIIMTDHEDVMMPDEAEERILEILAIDKSKWMEKRNAKG